MKKFLLSILLGVFSVNIQADTSELVRDAKASADWIAKALSSSGYKADFSLESLKEIDRFFDEHSKDGKAVPGGLLSQDLGARLFSLGSYIGETIMRQYGGVFIGDDSDPKGEINLTIKLENGKTLFPVQRVMKRFKNGKEDGIHVFGLVAGESLPNVKVQRPR